MRSRATRASRPSISESRSMPDLLAIVGLTAGYGEAIVLSNVSLTIAEGTALALLGRNGMGKTTLVNSIVGVTRHRGGTIVLGGQRHQPAAAGSAGACRRRLGAAGTQHLPVPHGRGELDRRRAPRSMERGARLRDVSASRGALAQSRHAVVGRRAADARGRARAHPQSAHPAARRAARRSGADHRR